MGSPCPRAYRQNQDLRDYRIFRIPRRASLTCKRAFVFVLAGFSVMAKSASRASEILQATLARYRMLFAKEPNVNGRQKKALSALATFGW